MTITFDDPSVATPPAFVGTIDVQGGVGWLDVDLPVPNVSRIVWRIADGDRVLASGTYGPREIRSLPLALLLSSRSAAAADVQWSDEEPIRISTADLPRRAASFDAVASLVVDGTTVAPGPVPLVTAAAAGTTVVLPRSMDGAYTDLTSLAPYVGRPVGAGTFATDVGDEPRRSGAIDLDVSAALQPPTWPHRTRSVALAATLLHLVVVAVLVHLPGPSVRTAAVAWTIAASVAGGLTFASDGRARSTSASMAVTGSNIARLTTYVTTTDPHGGTLTFDGVVQPLSGASAVRWSPNSTEVDVPGGTTVIVAGAPEVAFVQETLGALDATRPPDVSGWLRLPGRGALAGSAGTQTGGAWASDATTLHWVRAEDVP